MSGISTGVKIKEFSLPVKIAYGGLLTAVGVLLPQVFHVFGQ